MPHNNVKLFKRKLVLKLLFSSAADDFKDDDFKDDFKDCDSVSLNSWSSRCSYLSWLHFCTAATPLRPLVSSQKTLRRTAATEREQHLTSTNFMTMTAESLLNM